MRKLFFTLILVVIFLIVPNLYAAERLLNYGFEDWTGNMYTTPGYPFTSGYSSYMDEHEIGSEVITSYNADEMGHTWTAHSGEHFLIQNDSSSHALSPSVSGITGGGVNLHNNVGYNGTYGGPRDFDMDAVITTSEVFISVWAMFNKGWYTIQDSGRNKWFRFYADTKAVKDTVYMHLGTSSASPAMYFYCSGEPGLWIGTSFACTNAYDGNWHKFSMYINWNTGVILGWYDVENETIENASKSYTAEDGKLGNGSGPQFLVLKSNYSAKYPTEETYHAIDDIEIWDGMPDSEDDDPPGDITNFTAQAGDRQVALSWTNPTDSDFKGTMIRYSTEDDPYPATHNVGTFVCNMEAPGDSFRVTGLDNGTKYNFSAFTYDETGNYSETAHISATPSEADSDTTSPGYVTNFAAQTGDSQVVLNWTNPSDSDFMGTLIRYRTDGTYPTNNGDGIEVCNKTASPGTSDTHTLTGLTNYTLYYFSAFTYDETGNYSEPMHISAVPSANIYTKVFGDISGSDFPQTCKDTFLNVGEAAVNYSSNSESLNTYTWPTNTAANRIVMKWDLSALPQDVIIQEATLSLYMHSYSGDDNYEITAHKIINHNPDISSCTWNTYDATNSWTGGANGGEQDIASVEFSTIVDKTSGYKNWDITQMVQEWVDNSSTNFGLMLNSDTTAASDSNRYFRPTEYSSQEQRPVLTIKYGSSDIPKVPSAPTGLGVSVISE